MELQHHGVLGMKWGVRRFQNADGTRKEKKPNSLSTVRKENNKLSQEHFRRSISTNPGPKRKALRKEYREKKIQNIKNIQYKDIAKEAGKYTVAGLATSAAGAGAYALGAKAVGASLVGIGQSIVIGGMASSSINTGMAWYAKNFK